MTLWTEWWAWMLGALALGILEVLAPGWVALGFAVGAGLIGIGLLTGLLSSIVGLSGGFSAAVMLVLFAGLSLAAWFGLRKAFGPTAGETRTFDDDVND